MKVIPALKWRDYGSEGKGRTCIQFVDYMVDVNWTIFFGGTINNDNLLIAKFATFDNLRGPFPVQFSQGFLTGTIPAFTRSTIRLSGTSPLFISNLGNALNVIFSDIDLGISNDQNSAMANLFASQSTTPVASYLDNQTVTVGSIVNGSGFIYGYRAAPPSGGIADGTSNIYAGAAIKQFIWVDADGPIINGNLNSLTLTITGLLANSGWSTVNIGGNIFLRAESKWTQSTDTQWLWTGINSNPFGLIGAATPCIFL